MKKLTDAVEAMVSAAENGVAHVGAANYMDRDACIASLAARLAKVGAA